MYTLHKMLFYSFVQSGAASTFELGELLREVSSAAVSGGAEDEGGHQEI